jgi:alpha-tubulin suppressor-like RCC1 family protein
MKIVPPDNRSAALVWRLTLALALAALVPLLLYGSAPSWWSQRGVLLEDQTADDYAPVNQGQLKNIAKAAVVEMDAKLAGGAGEELHSLIGGWSFSDPATNDFAPVNLGQLKNVARPFFDRLVLGGIVDHYPWQSSLNAPDDFAVANIGQVKDLFSFEIPSANLLQDPLGDRISAGQYSANLALQAHAVWIWGDHFAGGNEFERNYPRRLTRLSSISSVSAGEHHLAVLHSDGGVSTWGENASGQLGDGTFVNRFFPGAVPNLVNIASVKAGGLHTLALRQDGTVVAWGDNYYGQLGSGDTSPSSRPALVIGLNAVRRIAAGFQRSAALKNDGTVWTWGYDHYSGHDIFNPFPSAVPGLTEVIGIAAGYEHTVAVKMDGTVWAWGSNYANQIGNGNPWWKFQDTPAQVPKLINIVKVASSYDHSLALAGDGTVWAWGENSSAQLGDGTNQARESPVQVDGLTDVIAIATTYSSSLAMKSDGTVWAWGEGATGTLPGADLHVPQLVGLGVLDANHNGMDDRWELQFLGSLDQSGDADFDGDGISNRREYLQGTDPTDYFNGQTPVIEIVAGNNQVGDPGTFLSKPFKVRLRNHAGQPLINAPVTFTVSAGALAPTLGGAKEQSLLSRTDANGETAAYHTLPDAPGTSSRTTAIAGKSDATASVVFRGVARLSLPPLPTPPPPPGTSPTPTPSPTATPFPPYRYAIIDLGKDMYPLRVNNKGWVLLAGFDANGEWGYFRWKGGAMERLTYSGEHEWFTAVDMNDEGVVVGSFRRVFAWVDNEENEIGGGLTWAAGSSGAGKTSAPVAARTWDWNRSGTEKWMFFTAISKNDIFGRVRTSGGYGAFFNTFDIFNAYSSIGPLSYGTATFSGNPAPSPDAFVVSGEIDTVSRANGDGHYIGSKLKLLRVGSGHPPVLEGTLGGMIDGHVVEFYPADINEAGVIVGSTGANMVVYSSPTSQATISDASPLAINDHTRLAPSPAAHSSPAPSPQPTAISAPQILGWTTGAQVLWERQPDGRTWHPFGLEEMIPSMDGWQALVPYDINDTGAIVGTGWYIDPSIPGAQGGDHVFLLVPVELMVDSDRDGKMSFDDPVIHDGDQTSEEKPFRFWVNDDQDAVSGTSFSDEIAPPQFRDNQDEKIQSIRDCEDLTRLWLNIRGFTESFKTGTLKFVLKFRNVTSGSPAIRVFRAVENGGRGYVTNEGWGTLQASPPFDRALPGGNGPGLASSTTGIIVDRQFWQGIDESSPVINLLFEGVEEGKGELYFEIMRDGRRIGTSAGVWLDIKRVEKMYERAKAQPEDIVAPYIVSTPFIGPVNYIADPGGQPFEKAWDESEQCVVFVHGWNVSYDEYRGVAQTMFKRLWHQGFRGHFASFRWDTRKSDGMFDFGEYNRSENRAYVYGAALKQWASDLSSNYTVNLIGHSMGNVVCGEALRQGMQVRNYLFMEAAIPMSCYVADAEREPRLEDKDSEYPTPDYHRNSTTNEATLGYRGYVADVAANLVNFYNEADWALATGRTEVFPGIPGLETNWEKNQIDYKPDGAIPGAIHAGSWSYHYDSSLTTPAAQRAWVVSSASRSVSDSWEMKAFVARSRTKAVGAFRGGGPIGAVENLGAQFGFGNMRSDHSGQFTRNIQAVDLLYKRIRERIEQ